MKFLKNSSVLIFFFIFGNTFSQTINTKNTRLLSQPAISQSKIAFIYAEDLWTANLDGSHPQRITIDEGVESNPVFSPDGKTIAFSAEYDGNQDVFTVPAEGGIPKRLTWHPYPDMVRDFTVDGKKVLFASQRDIFTNRYARLFEVDMENGNVEPLKIPNAFWAKYNTTGDRIAYTPISDRFTQWKNYRGGTATRIWIYNPDNYEVEEISKPETGSNDSQPIWLNGKVYFKSDRDGEFNLLSYTFSDCFILS
ncbi:hypothetical protein [Gramella sp. AN32]|uniref:Peptidase S41 n=1 Tax=Christiangramia antarctica TaxID=2058158 RepID=A0ABW5XA03_9FLAO|nr:hypothetical protein [Gramella sp. AN32]MCM4155253.1 hypothetical protein [Gramella sp. AN32]